MNVLLISMPDCVPYFDPKWTKSPSLAMASIAGNIDTHHNIYIADLVLKRNIVKDIVPELIHKYNPEVVGLSAMSFQFETAKKIATLIKAVNNHVITILGGYHVTVMYKEISEGSDSEPFDFLYRGEGDIGFNEFMRTLEKGSGFENINGLSYRQNGSFIHNPPRVLEDLNKIKLPDRSKRIWQGYNWYGATLEIIETSRGCTMPCNFCSKDKMYGNSFRVYEIDRIMNDIDNSKKHGAKCIVFADDNITLNIPRFEQLCDAIVDYGHNDIWYVIQASSLGIATSKTLVEKMAKAGIKIVFLGIENVSEENLKRMKKGNILEKTTTAIKKLHNHDIMIIGGMIIGHPDDKESDIAQNYNYFRENNVDFVGDQILTPYPKTGSRKEILELGLVTNKSDFTKYNGYWANVKTHYLSTEDLQFIRWKYNREYSKVVVGKTPAFKKNIPIGVQYMTNLQKSYKNVTNLLFGRNMTNERELYRKDMEVAGTMNNFF